MQRNIFVSYSRNDADEVSALVGALTKLDHQVWCDQELGGGQAWWDRILAEIRRCDLFVLALSPDSVGSTACTRELDYAAALRKTVLPVVVKDGLSVNLLPRRLAELHHVRFDAGDSESIFGLVRALGSAASSPALEGTLPPAPAIPVSYLGSLMEVATSEAALNAEKQAYMVLQLKEALSKPDAQADAREILARFRQREDLLASTWRALQALERSASAPPNAAAQIRAVEQTRAASPPRDVAPPAGPAPDEGMDGAPDSKSRSLTLNRAGMWGALGSVVGILAMIGDGVAKAWPFGFLTGVGAAVASALVAGRGRRAAALVLACGLVAGVLASTTDRDALSVGTVIGLPIGLFIGSVISRLFFKKQIA